MKTLQDFQLTYYRFRYDNRIPFERNGMRLLPVDIKRDGGNFTPHGMLVGNGPINNKKTDVKVAQVCALVPALAMPVVVKTADGKQDVAGSSPATPICRRSSVGRAAHL